MTEPQHGVPAAPAMEVLLTLLLVTAILSTATRHRVIGANAALAVGAMIAACGLFSRPISGASMNPARSLAPALIAGQFDHVWIYALGPLAGAVLALLLVNLLHGRPKPDEEKAAGGEEARLRQGAERRPPKRASH